MARFILDIANLSKEEIEKFTKDLIENNKMVSSGVSTLYCIDETNNAQHHHFEGADSNQSPMMNLITKKQIKNHKKILRKELG